MNINKYIFREYDIRGKVEDDFPPEVVENLGKAFGTYIKRAGGQEVALSGDVRLTTPQLIESFKAGVLSTGTDVINIGILPTKGLTLPYISYGGTSLLVMMSLIAIVVRINNENSFFK